MEKRKRIAFVNQRYGLEVNGGSEYYTRQLAEHLKDRYDIEILTTKALDYQTWSNYYTEDVEEINGIVVIRFNVEGERDLVGQSRYYRLAHTLPKGRQILENLWVEACGPKCPKLLKYIEKHHSDYDAIVFVTYLYYPAFFGVRIVPEKSILLPTAHDEPYIYMGGFRKEFEAPKGIIYLTHEEKDFVSSLFDVNEKLCCVAGAGVDLPAHIDNQSFREKFGVAGDYLIYVGRIGVDKQCDCMIRMFQQYKETHPGRFVKLVLMGKSALDLPDDDDIIATGFVSEQEKYDGISGAAALWMPSQFESLSIAVLEALSLGVPVLVNGDCNVLVGHCERSGAGWSYKGETEAVEAIDELLQLDNRDEVSQSAKRYIEESYSWDGILNRVSGVIDDVCEQA